MYKTYSKPECVIVDSSFKDIITLSLQFNLDGDDDRSNLECLFE